MKAKRRENGEGSLIKRKVTGRLEKKVTINGKRKSFYQRKNESCQAFNRRVHEETTKLLNGTYIKKSQIAHIEILKDFVEMQYKTNEVNAGTYGRNLNTIKEIEKTCANFTYKPIQKITVTDIINAFPLITEYSNNTINKIFRFVKKPFEIAISRRLISYNPMDSMEIKKPKSKIEDKRIEALSIDEQRKLEKAIKEDNTKYKNIVLLQLYTGMRIGEVLALKYEDIDFDKKKLYINATLTKNENGKVIMGNKAKTKKSRRTIPITPNVEEILKNEIQKVKNINGMLFFDNSKNNYLLYNGINSYLKRINMKYKIANNLHTHMLRHTYATRCFEADMSLKMVQELLGHENIEITMNIYTSLMGEYKETEMKKLNDYLEKICY